MRKKTSDNSIPVFHGDFSTNINGKLLSFLNNHFSILTSGPHMDHHHQACWCGAPIEHIELREGGMGRKDGGKDEGKRKFDEGKEGRKERLR